MKANIGSLVESSFLKKIFLSLLLLCVLVLLGLLNLFHKVTLTIAIHPGFIPVLAKFFGNVVPVELKPRIYKQAGKVHRNKRKYK